ncbi:MAG TPA: MFS transporter [Ktedonobacteraceae bacterium]
MLTTLRQYNFSLLWSAGLISMIGDWMLLIALPIYVYKLTGSALATSTMFIAEMIPSLLLGSVAGVFVDRWNRKRIMVITNLLLAPGLLPLLLVHSTDWLWVVYVVAFVESILAQFFTPAESALLPLLVSEEHLGPANSLNSLNRNIARLVGPPLGGIVAGLLGLPGITLIDAASFLIAGGLIALIVVKSRPTQEASTLVSTTAERQHPIVAVWHEWLEGLGLIKKERLVSIMFVLFAVTSLGEGVFGVLFVVFVYRILHGGALQLGWLMGAQAVGGLVGSVLVGYVFKFLSPSRLIGISAVLFGLIDLMIFNYPAFFPGFTLAMILFVLVGIPGTGAMTSSYTLLQTAVTDEYRGRIFGAIGTTGALFMLSGTILAGFLGDHLGVVTILNTQGAVYVLAGVFALITLFNVKVKVKVKAKAEIMGEVEETKSVVIP